MIMFDAEPPNEETFFKEKYRMINGKSVKYTKFMEHDFDVAKKKYEQYLTWKKNRNPERAILEDKFGYDTKHAGHLFRLLRMGHEILTTGKVLVYRPDREELLDIRRGAWSYEKVVHEAEKLEKELDSLYEKSTLQHSPKDKAIDKLLIEITEDVLNEKIFK